MGRTVILVVSIVTLVTTESFAQSSEPDLRVGELQKQLAELRSQMAAMQNRVATLETATGNPDPSSSTQPPHSQPLSLQPIRSQPDEAQNAGDSTAFHFKGLTVTPNGFLDSTVLLRVRN